MVIMATNISAGLAKQIQDALASTPIPSINEFIALSNSDPSMRDAGYANFGQPGWPNQTYQNCVRNKIVVNLTNIFLNYRTNEYLFVVYKRL
jgi:hypothetical protein